MQRDNLAAEPGTIPKTNYFKFTTYVRFMEEAGADLIMHWSPYNVMYLNYTYDSKGTG